MGGESLEMLLIGGEVFLLSGRLKNCVSHGEVVTRLISTISTRQRIKLY